METRESPLEESLEEPLMSAPTIADLGAATLFPYAPDGAFAIPLEEEWLTDVQGSGAGTEVRQAVRSTGVRTLTFTGAFLVEAELLAFRNRWLNATAPLRFLVPVWTEFSMIAALAGAVVTCDTTDRDFVAGGLAMLFYADPIGTDDRYELATIDSFDATSVTLTAPPAGTFPAYADGPSAIVPVMTGWVDPPTVEELAISAERMELVFREELPRIAGIDPTIVEDATPVAATVELEQLEGVQPFQPVQMTWRAIVKDAAGVEIPNAPLTWTIAPDYPTDPGVRFTVTPDEQEARLELAGAVSNHTLTATSGSASISIGIVTSA